MTHNENHIQPDPWETSQQFGLFDQHTLASEYNTSPLDFPKNQQKQQPLHITPKLRKQNKIFTKSQSKIGQKFIKFEEKRKSTLKNKNYAIFNKKYNGHESKQQTDESCNKTQLIRMQSCYPRLWHPRTNMQKNLSKSKLSQLNSIAEIQQEIFNLPQTPFPKRSPIKIRSRSQQKTKLKRLRLNTISTYDINQNFSAMQKLQKWKSQMQFAYNQKQYHGSSQLKDTSNKYLKKKSDKKEQFADLKFFWKDKNRDDCKQQKIKRIIQYKDKWSINLMKKTALTNMQMKHRHIYQGNSIYI